jgi:hypothetical protein
MWTYQFTPGQVGLGVVPLGDRYNRWDPSHSGPLLLMGCSLSHVAISRVVGTDGQTVVLVFSVPHANVVLVVWVQREGASMFATAAVSSQCCTAEYGLTAA